MAVLVRPLNPADWPQVRAIYQQGIDTGQATFETEAPPAELLAAKFLPEAQLVAQQAGQVVGWAMLSTVSSRCVYAGVAEVSVYVGSQARGQGIGKGLLCQLIEASEALGYWTLQASIFPENEASVRLHQQSGFRLVGYREKIASHYGIWRDVVLLERRSATIGQVSFNRP